MSVGVLRDNGSVINFLLQIYHSVAQEQEKSLHVAYRAPRQSIHLPRFTKEARR